MNFQMFKLVLEKAEESEIKLPTSDGSLKKQESLRKISTSALLTMPKPLTAWNQGASGEGGDSPQEPALTHPAQLPKAPWEHRS